MFIDKVMSEIWKSTYEAYIEALGASRSKSTEELKELCRNDINKLAEKVFLSDLHSLTIVETIGCQHQFKKNRISGCTFCDWDSARVGEVARLRALLEKDEQAYADVVKYSFQKIRGAKCSPTLIEQISIHDIMDTVQFPEAAFRHVFVEDSVYNTSPEIGIVSARASSVTAEQVKKWKQVFRKSLTIGIGIEVGNQWLRNNWLNKNITNIQIQRSIELIHENGAKVCANILLGIPELSNKNALTVFFDTCRYILEIGVDFILVSPLITKPKSLGSMLATDADESDNCQSAMIADAVYGITQRFSQSISKFTFSPDNFEAAILKAQGEEREFMDRVYKAIDNMGKVYTSKGLLEFYKAYEELKESDYYRKEEALMNSNSSSITEELRESALRINNILWDNDEHFLDFLVELEDFKESELL